MRNVLAWSSVAFLLSAAVAAEPRTGNSGRVSDTDTWGEHVLGGGGILYAPSEDDDPALRSAIAGFSGQNVDYLDTRVTTPTLGDLSAYSCVYTWTNFAYADPTGFGDVLADFVDAGGSVVLGVFTTFTNGNFLSGRVMTPGYCPVVGGDNHFSSSTYAGDGTTPIHNGVTAYECTFRDILTLQGDGAQDGSYVDGEIGHAYNTLFSVVYSNGSGATQLGCSGDWALLVANACSAIVPVELQGFDIE